MSTTIDFGIDLGTTNSCIARWEGGAVRVFQNNDHMNVTPSAVYILRTGRIIVGRRGYSAILTDPGNVAVEFKRWMGQKDRKLFRAAQRECSAEELSAEVLKSLREDVRRQAGADVTTAVITIPAAFGALQCEATARAAALAGLEEAPLLQEPIAAAVGYGAAQGSADQRWLVFDLGGGTLDVAVVSTRDGRLNVLEHRGNNLLGGKDIDRVIVEKLLLPALESTYDLRKSGINAARNGLLPRLRVKAEEAKIDLSTDSNVLVSLFDLGEDDSGAPIEIEIPITRAQLDSLTAPLLEKCLGLAKEALAGARLSGSDLDRILLVGGPTQAPSLRAALSIELGARVDFSADPMTVVGRGAAIYASTLERASKPFAAPVGCVRLNLAYEPVSAGLRAVVAGRVLGNKPSVEIKLEAEGGLWTSGWMKPEGGIFETPVTLNEGDVSAFWVYARDERGSLLDIDPSEFKIRHGLIPSAPPLPHTLSFEVVNAGGLSALDPVFPKGTPLPAERTIKYRATHALIPNNPASDIAIKLWEGEFLDDPDANEWVGRVLLPHSHVRRTVPEGAEIEITIQVGASGLITVEAFVAHLNQHFSKEILYMAQREEQDFSDLSRNALADIAKYRQRLAEVERASVPGEASQSEAEELRQEIEDLAANTPSQHAKDERVDPDDARRIVEGSKSIRGRLVRLERQAVRGSDPKQSPQFDAVQEQSEEVVGQFGTLLDKQQLAMLRRELERMASKGDDQATRRVCGEMEGLRWRVLLKHDWFWREIFDSLQEPGTPFLDTAASREHFARGRSAISSGNGEELREAVRSLWKLQPNGKADAIRDSAVRSGLRKF